MQGIFLAGNYFIFMSTVAYLKKSHSAKAMAEVFDYKDSFKSFFQRDLPRDLKKLELIGMVLLPRSSEIFGPQLYSCIIMIYIFDELIRWYKMFIKISAIWVFDFQPIHLV